MGVTIHGWRSRWDTPPRATSVLVTPSAPLFTLDQGKARAGQDWTSGDARDALMTAWIAAAQSKVEQDTGLALLTQTRDVYLDHFPAYSEAFQLPAQSTPLQSVTSIVWTDGGGTPTTIDPATTVLDLRGARIGLNVGNVWPTTTRTLNPIVVRIVAGYLDADALAAQAPLLVQAVGLLVAHYATLGRDLVSADSLTEVPYGYDDCIAPHQRVSVA